MSQKETLRNLSRKKRLAANKLATAIFRHITPIMSHEEVAAKMGISRRRVRQIEGSALRKLAERMRQACPDRCNIPADESNDDFEEA